MVTGGQCRAVYVNILISSANEDFFVLFFINIKRADILHLILSSSFLHLCNHAGKTIAFSVLGIIRYVLLT